MSLRASKQRCNVLNAVPVSQLATSARNPDTVDARKGNPCFAKCRLEFTVVILCEFLVRPVPNACVAASSAFLFPFHCRWFFNCGKPEKRLSLALSFRFFRRFFPSFSLFYFAASSPFSSFLIASSSLLLPATPLLHETESLPGFSRCRYTVEHEFFSAEGFYMVEKSFFLPSLNLSSRFPPSLLLFRNKHVQRALDPRHGTALVTSAKSCCVEKRK